MPESVAAQMLDLEPCPDLVAANTPIIKVQAADFDIGAELAVLYTGNHQIGAMASFVGLVRDMADIGRGGGAERIQTMTLEHYPGMTEKMLRRIAVDAYKIWPLQASLIIHRFGRLAPGERIVLVATASAHRQAALEACEYLIDWLKTKAPFWKLEESPDGTGHWVDARESDHVAALRWDDAE